MLTASLTYEICNYPEYLFFIIDLDYKDYFQYSPYLLKLFPEHISFKNNDYKIKGLVCMPDELHYTSYIFNNDKTYLDLTLNKTLFHEGKKNNCFVVECEETPEDIIKNIVSYIIILIK